MRFVAHTHPYNINVYICRFCEILQRTATMVAAATISNNPKETTTKKKNTEKRFEAKEAKHKHPKIGFEKLAQHIRHEQWKQNAIHSRPYFVCRSVKYANGAEYKMKNEKKKRNEKIQRKLFFFLCFLVLFRYLNITITPSNTLNPLAT